MKDLCFQKVREPKCSTFVGFQKAIEGEGHGPRMVLEPPVQEPEDLQNRGAH